MVIFINDVEHILYYYCYYFSNHYYKSIIVLDLNVYDELNYVLVY